VSKELKIGLIALVAGVLLYYGFNYLKGTDILDNTNRFYVEYDNTDNLGVGSAVKINGVKVGRVNNVVFQPESNNVLVELEIQGNIQLGDSTVAEMTNDGLLGGKAIVLMRKKYEAYLEPGSKLIPKVDKGLSEVLESGQQITDNIQITIRRINEILLGMEGFGESLTRAVQNMDTVLTDVRVILETNDVKIDSTVSAINSMVVRLDNSIEPLSRTMQNMESLSDSLKNTEFRQTVAKTNQLLDNLNATIDSLKHEQGTLGRLMKDDSLYNNLNKTLTDLDKLLIHFNNYPKDFMAPFGRKHKKLRGIEPETN
jgi:phospholipid/cholesterol/gamma-HCH transport system substrate-binding protein